MFRVIAQVYDREAAYDSSVVAGDPARQRSVTTLKGRLGVNVGQRTDSETH